jgi:hypothetical protein
MSLPRRVALPERADRHDAATPSTAGLHVSATARTASAGEMTDVTRRALAAGV